ncbi:MAG: hypothetical protein IH948_08820, partial [Bacteroidetes bacterium]|nr:hypothetical protein [Bacteroidota bacterium]
MSNIDANIKLGKYQMGQNPLVETTWLQFHNTSHSAWIIKVGNAVKLFKKIQELNPKHILELGTGIGCSTSIMASACPEASIYTVESNQKCLDVAKKMIPITFQERIYF